VSASKNRPRWAELPVRVRSRIEELAGGPVVRAENCTGGFSPGFASRLILPDGQRAFAKAMDARAWPFQAAMYAVEARVAALLPQDLPVPRFLGSVDDEDFVILAFECADGAEPAGPWRPAELAQVAAAVSRFSLSVSPSPVRVPAGHPRLGGWEALAGDPWSRAGLARCSPWAAGRLDELLRLEERGLDAARGDSLVHFDMLPHNILRTPEQVLLIDWPHARLGARYIDVLMLMASAAADGIDPEPLLAGLPVAAAARPGELTAVLVALTGFWLAGALAEVPPGLQPVRDAKLVLARGGLAWLKARLQ
jgi:hypothetical protein